MKNRIFLSLILTLIMLTTLTSVSFAQEDLSQPDETEPVSKLNAAFEFTDGENLTVYSADSEIILCPVRMTVDLNGDNKTTSADARLILRHSAKIELYTGEVDRIDITGDGSLNALDARLALRYSANLDKYYRMQDGSLFSGLCKTQDSKMFIVTEHGAVASGFVTIDGNTYYCEKGYAITGAKTIDGILCYFDNDGKAANGEYTVSGKKIYFEKGRSYNGYRDISGKKVYYIQGTPANGNVEIDGVTYFFENGVSSTGYKTENGIRVYYVNGILADGLVNISDNTYFFSKGVMQQGWQTVKGEYYHFDRADGKLLKNTTADGIKVDASGKAEKTAYNTEKIKTFMKARKIMLRETEPTDTIEEKKLKCFKWVMSCPYRQYRQVGASMKYSGWEMKFANDIFDNGNGCCGSTTGAFAFLAVECGCKDVYFCDDGVSTGGHAWVIMEGNNRVYDVIFAKSKSFEMNYDYNVSDYRSFVPRKTYIGG